MDFSSFTGAFAAILGGVCVVGVPWRIRSSRALFSGTCFIFQPVKPSTNEKPRINEWATRYSSIRSHHSWMVLARGFAVFDHVGAGGREAIP